MPNPVRYRLPRSLMAQTFEQFRSCGRGHRECQAIWIGPWSSPDLITAARHPRHNAHAGGFDVDSRWLTGLWNELADMNLGIRVQVHTHPHEAFHSRIDDAYPIIHTVGFLSL